MASIRNAKVRIEVIKELQKIAEEIRGLKDIYRQKRPIVIEFSGSPKSGKTSCINSLQLFLRRNGFKVEIIQERANVCPVYNKQSPMFNLWTGCMSLVGMLSILEREEVNCDVLLMDRGIFDAFCWFDWLAERKLMENDQRETFERFFLIEDLIKKVDIVFAFCVDPNISLEREYTTLLTDKLGTIMNIQVLSEYLNSIKRTIVSKHDYFHSIFKIDTSQKNQDEVGKEVTDITLDTLRDLLVERIGYISFDNDAKEVMGKKRVLSFDELNDKILSISFDLRDKVEGQPDLIQPIPIAVITNKERNKILAIKKNAKALSPDSPEKDKYLLYIGGHSRIEDVTKASSTSFLSVCRYTLRREVREEIGLSLAFNEIEPYFIYTPDTDKSKQHIGVCFVIEIDIDSIKLRLDPQELELNNGLGISGLFQDIPSLIDLSKDLESWSKEILRESFGVELGSNYLLPV